MVLSIERSNGLGVEFKITAPAADLTGTAAPVSAAVIITSEVHDNAAAVHKNVLFIGEEATVLLTETEAATLGSDQGATPDANDETNVLAIITDANNAETSLVEQISISNNEPPKFDTILSADIEENDNCLVVTITQNNADKWAGALDLDSTKFKMFYSYPNATGQVAMVNAVQGLVNVNKYTLTTETSSTKLPNNQLMEVWFVAQSETLKGGHKTDLNGVAGTSVKPNNLPNPVTLLDVQSNYTAGISGTDLDTVNSCLLEGNWVIGAAEGSVADCTFTYKYGKVAETTTGSGVYDFLNNEMVLGGGNYSFIETSSGSDVPFTDNTGDFSLQMPAAWFGADSEDADGNNTIRIGMQVTQTDGADVRVGPMQTAIALNPTEPTISFNGTNGAAVNVTMGTGVQELDLVVTGMHVNTNILTVEYRNGFGNWSENHVGLTDTSAAGGSPADDRNVAENDYTAATLYAKFSLNYADITTGFLINIRVTQDDPNNSQNTRQISGDVFKLYKHKNVVLNALTLTEGNVAAPPTAHQTLPTDTSGFVLSEKTLVVSNGYGATLANRCDVATTNNTDAAALYTSLVAVSGYTCTNTEGEPNYIPGVNVVAVTTDTYVLDTNASAFPGYGDSFDDHQATSATSSAVRYYERPTITSVEIITPFGGTTDSILRIVGNTNGSSFFAGSVIGYALVNSGNASTVSVDNFQKMVGNVATVTTDYYNPAQGLFEFSRDLDFVTSIVTTTTGNETSAFRGLAYLDAVDAPSDLMLLTEIPPVYIWTAAGNSEHGVPVGAVEDGTYYTTQYAPWSTDTYAEFLQNQLDNGNLVIQ